MMKLEKTDIVMIASENGSLKNGKVGGLADVIRDLPRALGELGLAVTVITPSYGFLHVDNRSEFYSRPTFPFNGKSMNGEMWKVTPENPHRNVANLVFESPEIRGEPIYSNDPPEQPFARDATKYSLFCSAVGQFLKELGSRPIIHIHDWHTGALLLLKELHPGFEHLKKNKIVFTIHNLSYQGSRPIFGRHASVGLWFPGLLRDAKWISDWKDPRYEEPTFTPLAAAIRHSDKISTVSPSYAREILSPGSLHEGIHGGEGLELLLRSVADNDRLVGILNGIEYPDGFNVPRMPFGDICSLVIAEIKKDTALRPGAALNDVLLRLNEVGPENPAVLLTSITRITDQKIRILFEPGSDGRPAVDKILEHLKARGGIYFIMGSGEKKYEEKCWKAFREHQNMIYIPLFSEPAANALYANGSIFIMPSSFEPCGIGQMLAMRNGQPCVVNAVGGLTDTVADGVNGFHFSGKNPSDRVDNFVLTTRNAVDLFINDKPKWEQIRQGALSARFDWKTSAERYVSLLYDLPLSTYQLNE